MATETQGAAGGAPAVAASPTKLHGRAFYESIGSPKYVVAPMVDQSEFAWRMLTRSFLPPAERPKILAYSPMLHARLFVDSQKYRRGHFEPTREQSALHGGGQASSPSSPVAPPAAPYLDGNPALDRPLFVQFCANDPAALLAAAQLVAPHCDAVDLNLGCPQGIARRGHYGAFLQEDQDLIFRLVNTLHTSLPIPVTAKIRILDSLEATLAYAQTVLRAGASILTVHGRRREQKGHLTGLADWAVIRYLREKLPPDTVLFANGNVLQPRDLQRCLEATGADAVMSAEGNLSDPALFAPVPEEEAAIGADEGREFWRGRDGKGGWRVDAVVRRYLDILHRYVLDEEPPARRALFVPGDDAEWLRAARKDEDEAGEQPARKKQKREGDASGGGGGRSRADVLSPNFSGVQGHLFHLLRHFVTRHTDVRDVLARTKGPNMDGYERVLAMVERRVAEGLLEYERTDGRSVEETVAKLEKKGDGQEEEAEQAVDSATAAEEEEVDDPDSSVKAVQRCRRPWWVVQPIIRPLPKEALAKGAVQPKAKDKASASQSSQQSGPGAGSPASLPKDLSAVEPPAMSTAIGLSA